MLLSTGWVEIQIYKERLTSAHSWYISQDVGNCHNSLRVVLCECQSLTSALTSERGLLRSGMLSSLRLCAVTAPCICDSDMFGVSGVGFRWAEPRWPEGRSRISSSDRSALIQLHTEKLDWHFLLPSYIVHAKRLSALFELRGWAAVVCFCEVNGWRYMFTKPLSMKWRTTCG